MHSSKLIPIVEFSDPQTFILVGGGLFRFESYSPRLLVGIRSFSSDTLLANSNEAENPICSLFVRDEDMLADIIVGANHKDFVRGKDQVLATTGCISFIKTKDFIQVIKEFQKLSEEQFQCFISDGDVVVVENCLGVVGYKIKSDKINEGDDVPAQKYKDGDVFSLHLPEGSKLSFLRWTTIYNLCKDISS